MRLNKILHILTLVFFLAFSCSSDDGNNNGETNETTIDLVTGLIARQDSFSAGFLLGNPNIRMPLSLASTTIVAFPNPSTGFLSIMTNEIITNVWVIPATANRDLYQSVDYDEVLTENTYTENEISQLAVESFNDLNNNDLLINLEGLETGYYRVFIKTNQSLYWDNIYVDNGDGIDITELFDYWE